MPYVSALVLNLSQCYRQKKYFKMGRNGRGGEKMKKFMYCSPFPTL